MSPIARRASRSVSERVIHFVKGRNAVPPFFELIGEGLRIVHALIIAPPRLGRPWTSASRTTCATRAAVGPSPDGAHHGVAGGAASATSSGSRSASRATASRQATFDASGCGAALAAASRGRRARRRCAASSTPPASARRTIAAELGGLSPGKLHAADLASDALHRALGEAVRGRRRARAQRRTACSSR